MNSLLDKVREKEQVREKVSAVAIVALSKKLLRCAIKISGTQACGGRDNQHIAPKASFNWKSDRKIERECCSVTHCSSGARFK